MAAISLDKNQWLLLKLFITGSMLGGRFRIGTSIANPKEVRNRETFGHWELDTVVFPEAKARVV